MKSKLADMLLSIVMALFIASCIAYMAVLGLKFTNLKEGKPCRDVGGVYINGGCFKKEAVLKLKENL